MNAADRLADLGALKPTGRTLPSFFSGQTAINNVGGPGGSVGASIGTAAALGAHGEAVANTNAKWFKALAIGTGVAGGLATVASIVDAVAEHKLHGECAHDNTDNGGGQHASAHCQSWENFDNAWAYITLTSMFVTGSGMCGVGWFLTPAARVFVMGAGLLLLVSASLATVGQVQRHELYKTCGRKTTYTSDACTKLSTHSYWMFRTVGEIVIRALIVLMGGIFLALMHA